MITNFNGMLFCYPTKPEMDRVHTTLTDRKIPAATVLKAWNQERPPYPWTVALICKDKAALDVIDNILCDEKIDTGEADMYAGEERIRGFFTMLLIGKYEPGIVRIEAKECPRKAISSTYCTFCQFGHLLECHHPMNCLQANCSHLKKYEDF